MIHPEFDADQGFGRHRSNRQRDDLSHFSLDPVRWHYFLAFVACETILVAVQTNYGLVWWDMLAWMRQHTTQYAKLFRTFTWEN